MKKLNIKKHFTLLELMVTMVLLVICFSIIGINVNKSLYAHKWNNNLKKIDMYFDFCKKMAFSNQADIYLNLSQVNSKIYFEIGTDATMGFFKNSKKTKDYFEDIYFLYNDKKIDKLEILFCSTGMILPKGTIEFLDKKKKFKQLKNI